MQDKRIDLAINCINGTLMGVFIFKNGKNNVTLKYFILELFSFRRFRGVNIFDTFFEQMFYI